MNRIDPYSNHQRFERVKVGGPNCPPPINDPTLAGKLEESIMRTHELDSVLCAIAERIFGYQDAEVHQETADGPAPVPYQPHAIEMAANISERMAQCVGFCRDILRKIDGR